MKDRIVRLKKPDLGMNLADERGSRNKLKIIAFWDVVPGLIIDWLIMTG
jgi:hypothetical protein